MKFNKKNHPLSIFIEYMSEKLISSLIFDNSIAYIYCSPFSTFYFKLKGETLLHQIILTNNKSVLNIGLI